MTNPNRPEWSSVEVQILTDFYVTESNTKLMELLPNRSRQSIRYKAFSLGLVKDLYAYKRLPINENYFSKYTEHNCYWAGFIAADGCLTTNNRITILLADQDIEHLILFANHLQFAGSPRTISRAGNKETIKGVEFTNKNLVQLEFSNPKITTDLIQNFNLGPRKSLTLMPPPLIQREHILAYLAGIVDGDGWITFGKAKTWIVGLVATWEVNTWFKCFLNTNYPVTYYKPGSVRNVKQHPLTEFTVTGHRAKQLLRDMIKLEIPRLARKWDRVEQILFTEGFYERE